MTARAIRAVLFDLGGTLWEYRPGLTIEAVLTSVAPRAIALLPPAQASRLAPEAVAVAVRSCLTTSTTLASVTIF